MKLRQMLNMMLAVVLAPLLRRVRTRPLVLVGGHEGRLFVDNGRAMYRFLRSSQTTYDVFWVIDADSPHWDQVSHPVRRGSLRNYLYFLVAAGGFYSHTASDIAPVLHRLVTPRMVRVFVEHGIVGLKRAKLTGRHHRTGHLGPDADLWVSVSEFERDLKTREWGLPADQVKVTGLPRYDELHEEVTRSEIAYLPTWREWLHDASDEEFTHSEFFAMVDELITSPAIAAVLEEGDIQLVVYLHFYFHRHLDKFAAPSDRIRFAAVDADIQEAILHSRVMVTDYSSVAWDFFYLGKPVLFHQPDLETYLDVRGAYLDMAADLFGPRSQTLEQLAHELRGAIEAPGALAQRHAGQRSKYFAYTDTENCRRVYEAFTESVVKSAADYAHTRIGRQERHG